MKKLWKTIAVLSLISILFAGTLGCNTLEGLGQDVEQAGEEIEEEASE